LFVRVHKWQLITMAIDYGVLALIFMWCNYWYSLIDVNSWKGTYEWQNWRYVVAIYFSRTVMLWLKEQLYFYLMGDMISKEKRDWNFSKADWYYILQNNIIIGTLNTWIAFGMGRLYFFPVGLDWRTFKEVFCAFWAMALLKDYISNYYLHTWMHKSKWAYRFHKQHHTVKKNAQSLMAYNAGAVDLILESGCAPYLLHAFQYLLGYSIGIHLYAVELSVFLDIGIHSANPFSCSLFNPVLDWLFWGNVAHSIHHTLQHENYVFIPLHHIDTEQLKLEQKKYDKIMGTSFFSGANESDIKKEK